MGLMTHAETRKSTIADYIISCTTLNCPFRTIESWRSLHKWVIQFAHVTNLKELSDRLNFKRTYLPPQLLTISTTIPVLPLLRMLFTEQGFRYSTSEERDVSNLDNTNKKHLAQLPASYDNEPPLILPKTEPPVLPLLGPFVSNCIEMPSAIVTEFKWLDNVRDRLNHEISKDTFRGILRICSCQLCRGKS